MTKSTTTFKIIAGALTIWNLMGLLSFIGHLSMTAEKTAALPQAEQELYDNNPSWIKFVFGVAVITGLAASVLLFLRNKLSVSVFSVSLIAVLIQMNYNLFFTNAIDYYGAQAVVMPIIITALAFFGWWYSRKELL